jgi:hypothetical protein
MVTGWPRLLWFVTDSKHVVKPPKDWYPPIQEASNYTTLKVGGGKERERERERE